MLRRRTLPLALLAVFAAAPVAGAADRYSLKASCRDKAMLATVTGPNIKRVAFTTKRSRIVVRRAPWTAEFARAGRLVAKATLATKGHPVVRLEAAAPRC